MHDLEHPLGTGEIGKAMLPQIEELDRRLTRELTRRQRQHDLPAVRGRHETRRAVHRAAVVVAIAQLGLTRVQPHPHPEPPRHLPRLTTERELRRDGGVDRIVRGAEHGVEPVACRFHHEPVVSLDRLVQNRVMTGQGGSHRLGMLFPRRVEPSRSVNKNVTVPEGSEVIMIRTPRALWSAVCRMKRRTSSLDITAPRAVSARKVSSPRFVRARSSVAWRSSWVRGSTAAGKRCENIPAVANPPNTAAAPRSSACAKIADARAAVFTTTVLEMSSLHATAAVRTEHDGLAHFARNAGQLRLTHDRGGERALDA